jgi:hypothetical protein
MIHYNANSATLTIKFESETDYTVVMRMILEMDNVPLPAKGGQITREQYETATPVPRPPVPSYDDKVDLITILNLINRSPSKRVRSRDVATSISAEPKGMGVRNQKYRRILGELGVDMDDVVVVRRTGRDGNYWRAQPQINVAIQLLTNEDSIGAVSKEGHAHMSRDLTRSGEGLA